MLRNKPFEFGSVCSGIEAASVAWAELGWHPAWFSEIEPFPCALLAHHYPTVPNHGDMKKLQMRIRHGEVKAPDLLCGGTPCQAFSVAGKQESLDDDRGNLTLTFCEIANAIDDVRIDRGEPEAIIFWENVPGVLATKDNAFGCFLAAIAGEDEPFKPAGKGWPKSGYIDGPRRSIAWRTLDAQYFGLAQRRKRVFVVASARAGFDPAAILFEFEGMRRDIAPSRQTKATVAALTANGVGTCGADDNQGQAGHLIPENGCFWDGGQLTQTLDAVLHKGQMMPEKQRFPAGPTGCSTAGNLCHTLKGEGFDASEDGTGRGTPIIAFSAKDHGGDAMADCSPTLRAGGHHGSHANAGVMPAITVSLRGREGGGTAELGGEIQNCIRASKGGGDKPHVLTAMQVRRLTPRECERLQGFPDDYTLIPHPTGRRKDPGRMAADGPRYKAIGNSWAVPCIFWIGERIQIMLEVMADG